MTPQRQKIGLWLANISGFGLLISSAIHIATFRDFNIEDYHPLIFLLHLWAITSGFLLVFVLRLEKRSATERNQPLLQSVWPLWLAGLLGLYGGFTLLNVAPHLGISAATKGEFGMLDPATVINAFPDRDSFEAAKRTAGIMSTRFFSGIWLTFFGAAFIIPQVSRKGRNSQPHSYGKSPTAELKAKIASREIVEVPAAELLNYAERMSQTHWRWVKYGLLFQIGALWLLGIVFQNGFLLFAGTFISLGLVNYFFYRKQVRDYLTKLQFEEDSCQISLLRGDAPEELNVPLPNLRVEIEKRMTKGNPQFFLCFKKDDQLILSQKAGIGFWTRERIETVAAAFNSKPPVD